MTDKIYSTLAKVSALIDSEYKNAQPNKGRFETLRVLVLAELALKEAAQLHQLGYGYVKDGTLIAYWTSAEAIGNLPALPLYIKR